MNRNSNSLKRILCIVGGMNAGGAETFLMKVYRELDKTKYQMDFYVTIQQEGFYDKEIISMGGKIYRSIPKTKGFISAFKSLKETVQNEQYEYVMRVSQHSLSTIDLLAAKLGGAQTLIYRSSNSHTGDGIISEMLHNFFKWLPMTIPTIKFAPSTEAAEFMFGKDSVKKGKAKIIKNAIPVENYIFNHEKRENIRKEFKINDQFVIGHVGRFNSQKNHSFLIDIFSEIVNQHENSVLMLVGIGELEDDIKAKIKILGLKDKVIFTGIRADVPDILMAMDIMIFPSLFEGMPNVIIEAQATGLPCIISDAITREVNITGLVKFISLNNEVREWAKLVFSTVYTSNREDIIDVIRKEGYRTKDVVRNFTNIVFKD